MKTLTAGLLVSAFLLGAPGWSQSAADEQAKLSIDLPELEQRADEVVEVNLEGRSLDVGRKLLILRKGVSRSVKEFVKGLKGVYVRRFWFASKKAYSREDTDPIRKQLKDDGWVRMIDVRDRRKTESVAVYSYVEDEKVAGVTVVFEEPQELTVINIVGPVDLEALSELGSQMGLPVMKLATRDLPKKKALPEPR